MIDQGILLALLSATLFGASTPLAKLLLGTVDPWLMAGLLYIGTGTRLAGVHLPRTLLPLPRIEALVHGSGCCGSLPSPMIMSGEGDRDWFGDLDHAVEGVDGDGDLTFLAGR